MMARIRSKTPRRAKGTKSKSLATDQIGQQKEIWIRVAPQLTAEDIENLICNLSTQEAYSLGKRLGQSIRIKGRPETLPDRYPEDDKPIGVRRSTWQWHQVHRSFTFCVVAEGCMNDAMHRLASAKVGRPKKTNRNDAINMDYNRNGDIERIQSKFKLAKGAAKSVIHRGKKKK